MSVANAKRVRVSEEKEERGASVLEEFETMAVIHEEVAHLHPIDELQQE